MTQEHQFASVKIGRLDGDDGPNYEIFGLPEGADFRDPDNYERLTATWLKVNGIGFATRGAELSEYGKKITIEQDIEGGSARIGAVPA